MAALIDITERLLVKLAGQGAYERGVNYFTDGRVTAVESDDRRTTAIVHGTEAYTVKLAHTHSQLEGACDCPASEGIDFCKHCVALALVLKERQRNGTLLEHGNDEEKLEAYLKLQTPETLVSELMQATQRLPEFRERLLIQADLIADSAPAKRLKKAITSVTRPRHLWEYRQVATWFARVEATLENIRSVANQIAPDVLLKTVLYAFARLEKALEQIDDSGGYRFRTYSTLQDLHGEALQRVDWTPEHKAAHLLDLVLDSDSDQFDDVPHAYADALAADGLDAFYADVAGRLNSLPALSAGADFNEKYPYLRLSSYLKDRAAECEDWASLIALEKATATDERDYRRIASLCLRIADTGLAAEWLASADALDGGTNAGAASLWVQVHIARENWREAVNTQSIVFQYEPEYENYSQLIELAERANCADEVRAEAKAMLSEPVRNLWQAARHAFTLARILRDEQDWEASYQAIVGHVVDPDQLLEAARWLSEPVPNRAGELYARAIEALIGKKDKRGYQTAVNVLLEARPCFDAVDSDEFTRFVAALRTKHKQKRNLMAALDASL